VEGIKDIRHEEIERHKERVRRVWRYRRVDHIPLNFFLDDYSTYTLKKQCLSGEAQFEVNVRSIDRLLRLLPDDYIPAARVWPGYITIATMFGLQAYWSDDPNQAPGVAEHPIRDMGQVYELETLDRNSGLMSFNLRWLRYFAEHLPVDVSLTGIDLGGPINTAKDLLDTNLLYTAFYDSLEETIRGYEEIAGGLAPDVVGIPIVWLTDRWGDQEIRELYHSLLGVAERYARETRWNGESRGSNECKKQLTNREERRWTTL